MTKLFKYIFFLLINIQPLIASTDHTTAPIDTKKFTIFGEFLYWNVSEQTDSVWANDIGFPATNHVTYSTPNVPFNWNSGFRGGISYDIPHFWDLKLYWTHFTPSKNIDYIAAPNHLLTPEFFSGYLSSDTFSSANMNWSIAMNTIDFEISHKINVTDSLMINPSIGVKEATINQRITLGLNNTLFSVPIFSATEVVKNNFTGIGPSFGINGKLNVYKRFSLVGNFFTAFMWGRWNVNDTYSRPSALFGLIKPAIIDTEMSNATLGTAMFQYFLGVEWTYQSTYLAKFLLGYEMQFWGSQLRAPTFQLLPLHGDLTLQGGTCGISISL